MTLDEAKKIIKSECYIADLLNLDRTQMVNTALDTVIEAAEHEKKGTWIKVVAETGKDCYGEDYEIWYHKCSECGARQLAFGTQHYCQKCGAKMAYGGDEK